ncbi:Ig-like domain-containing protein [Archangium lansingense]|uniref:Lipoprotein n=1 Tax=Archangium lansingense TaxID=2995310 RepID=A0ABT4APG8_9BACT|nr:hypothetical protein [Archangium lansinium]MCY1083578.1 hypothetical protein [Archangium lansinium]
MRIAAILTLSAVLSACSNPDETFCTLEARASVQVSVVDTKGNPQRDARVTFTLDGGAEQQALCNGSEQAQGNCDTWVTGYEQPGDYVITATSADGQRTARQSVSVTEDECHVQTQTVTLKLPD